MGVGNFSLMGILYNWEASMLCGLVKEKWVVSWSLPPSIVLKFNADGATRDKPGPVSIGGVLHNDKGKFFVMFSKGVGVKDSNKTEVLAILKTLRIFFLVFSR